VNGPAELVIVANRLPVDRVTRDDGTIEWRGSPGGLVTALEPIMRANEGIWVGWPGGTDADVEPFEHDGMTLEPVALSAQEVEGFYEGLSNATIWPLYHDLVAKPEFHREWWDSYVDVNRRFAERAAARAAKDATVWVQDYQLQLVPQLLRELRPDLRIGFFLHIPFPPAELFQQLPWRRQLLEGLLGADLVGFQLPGGAANFVRLVRQRVGHKTHRDLVYLPDGRTVRAAAFPISIDYEGFEGLARSEPVKERSASIRRRSATRTPSSSGSTGSTTPRASTPGCARSPSSSATASSMSSTRCSSRSLRRRGRRSRSIACCATRSTAWSATSTAISVGSAAPRSATSTRRTPARRWPPSTAPRRDGGDAVPRRHEPGRQGVRRLPVGRGRRAGALGVRGSAAELRQAWQVNPYDLNGMKAALLDAARAEPRDRQRRMRAMRKTVKQADVAAWATAFLDELDDVRPPHGKKLKPTPTS
jgi:trehalose 6-phosphate synthase